MKITDEDHEAAKRHVEKIMHEIETLEGEGSFRLCDASSYYDAFMEGLKHACVWTTEQPEEDGPYWRETPDGQQYYGYFTWGRETADMIVQYPGGRWAKIRKPEEPK